MKRSRDEWVWRPKKDSFDENKTETKNFVATRDQKGEMAKTDVSGCESVGERKKNRLKTV
jgi:hypothetical protein